jgi:hypothetical protein
VLFLDSGPFRDGMLTESPFYGNVPVSSNGRFVRKVCRFLEAGFWAGVGCSFLILDPFRDGMLAQSPFYGNVPVSSNGRFVREVCTFLEAGFWAGVGCSCLILDPCVMAY